MRKRLVCLAIGLTLAGCAEPGALSRPRCLAGTPSLMVALFFGRSMPDGGMVSDRDWRRFEDQVVARDLPDGFTVLDASGAWRSPQGHATSHEPTRLVLVSLPDRPEALGPVQRVRTAYQARFHQQLVGMSVMQSCGAF